MGVGTNLGRKSVAGSESCRSVVAGAPLPSPGGGGGGGGGCCWRRGRINGEKGKEGCRLFMCQWPSFTTPTIDNFLNSIAGVVNDGH